MTEPRVSLSTANVKRNGHFVDSNGNTSVSSNSVGTRRKKNVTVSSGLYQEKKKKGKKEKKKGKIQLKLNHCSILATDANGTTQL